MYKKIITLTIMFLILVGPVSAFQKENLKFRNARFIEDYVIGGDELVILLKIGNSNTKRLRDLKVTILIPELAVRRSTGNLDVKANREVTRRLVLDLPRNTRSGWYDARITISNDKVRRVIHRDVYISSWIKVIYV